ncbi:glutathione S-transferase family protein [Sphingopyxis sp. LK2115]|jgi:glutathione S-transferase|uniref:glutathione S-transferase family protein n=1 Tax=Sphingopyxis sp. LK2115 TaxID=2744558 RepID=UPI0016613F85|nr:glutathione S-transferase family protein [Sphingopyxis sp. LK2115]
MLIFYGHPFSSYAWKALIALYEKGVAFEYRALETEEPFTHYDELRSHWPVGQFPLIVDDGVPIFESSIIIEYLDQRVPDPRLIPADPRVALELRFLDRIFDNHFQARFQAVVAEYLPFITEKPDLARVERARDLLEKAYGWLETKLPDDGWATPHGFSLADCAAAPALFYADWVHPIDPRHARVRAYRARLLARPSVSRCIEDARPYRSHFPFDVSGRD